MQRPTLINARQLRDLAERASSARGPHGDPYYIVEKGGPDHRFYVLTHGDPDQPPPVGAIFEIDTHERQPRRPKVDAVVIESDGVPVELAHQYDAVFWSEAAVEKFLFPYYASKSLWSAARVLAALSRAWYGYLPREYAVEREDAGRAGEDEAVREIPFAMAHLPSSEWVGESEAGPDPEPDVLGRELHVLFRDPDGGVFHRHLSEYL